MGRAWLGGLEPETARVYGAVLRRLAQSAGDPLGADERDLAVFVKGSGTLAMRRRCVSALHSFYRFALDDNAITVDPSRNVYLRLLERSSNADLLREIGGKDDITWNELLGDAVSQRRLRWGTEAGREALRRAITMLRKCRDEKELLSTLRSRFAPHTKRRR